MFNQFDVKEHNLFDTFECVFIIYIYIYIMTRTYLCQILTL
jgi:hypothetical protein